MEPLNTACVFIVDDDAAVREALAWLLRSRRLHSESFDSAEAFAAALQARAPLRHSACLLLDIRMGTLSGLALFEQLRAQGTLAGHAAGHLPHRPCRRAHGGGSGAARRL